MKNTELRRNPINDSVILCCGSKRCPEVSIENDMIKIQDDYGQTVKMSKEQASLIQNAVDMLTKND